MNDDLVAPMGTEARCPHCSASIRQSAAFCSECGSEISLRKCVTCRSELALDDKFCASCGKSTVAITGQGLFERAESLRPVQYVHAKANGNLSEAQSVAMTVLLAVSLVGTGLSLLASLALVRPVDAVWGVFWQATISGPAWVVALVKSPKITSEHRSAAALGAGVIIAQNAIMNFANFFLVDPSLFGSLWHALRAVAAIQLIRSTLAEMPAIERVWSTPRNHYLTAIGVALAGVYVLYGLVGGWSYGGGGNFVTHFAGMVLLGAFAIAASASRRHFREGAVVSLAFYCVFMTFEIVFTQLPMAYPRSVWIGGRPWPLGGLVGLGLCAALFFAPDSLGRKSMNSNDSNS